MLWGIIRIPQRVKADGFRLKEKNHSFYNRTNDKDWRGFGIPPSPEGGGNLGVTVEDFEWYLAEAHR